MCRGIALVLLFLTTIVGCEKSHRAELSGTITFGGEPIPAGRIYFNPDLEKKNDGPQGWAEIKDGVYDTRKNGLGFRGGPAVVVIQGFAGGADGFGPPLFQEYKITVDLPKVTSVSHFDVPADAPKVKLVHRANPKSS